jgi:hypothetical protein
MKRFERHGFAWSRAALAALALALPTAMLVPATSAADITKTPPAKFKKVSTLVKLPDFIPGMGTLYVDPATLPVGPFLGYNRGGKLVNVIYMVPMKDLEAHKNFDALGGAAKGLKVDHTAIEFNPGHPGVEEPHYHVTQWLISPAAVKKDMK